MYSRHVVLIILLLNSLSLFLSVFLSFSFFLSLCLSLSLSHTRTHTHTHTLSLPLSLSLFHSHSQIHTHSLSLLYLANSSFLRFNLHIHLFIFPHVYIHIHTYQHARPLACIRRSTQVIQSSTDLPEQLGIFSLVAHVRSDVYIFRSSYRRSCLHRLLLFSATAILWERGGSESVSPRLMKRERERGRRKALRAMQWPESGRQSPNVLTSHVHS